MVENILLHAFFLEVETPGKGLEFHFFLTALIEEPM